MRAPCLLFLALLVGLVSVRAACGSPLAFRSIPVPLTTVAQNEAGIEGGEGFQKVLDIAYAPSNPDYVYLVTDTLQAWRSEDGGESWTPCNKGYGARGGTSIWVHPNNPRIVFVAGSLGQEFDRSKNKPTLQGVFRSIDGGDSWQLVQKAPFYKQEACTTLFAADSRTLSEKDFTLYVGDYQGNLLVSGNSGKTWQRTGINEGRILDVFELPFAHGNMLLCTENGLFRYDGNTTHRVGAGLPGPPLSIAVAHGNSKVVYAVLGKAGIYRSDDGGLSFQVSLRGNLLNGDFTDVAVSPQDEGVAIAIMTGRRGGPFHTKDGGESWERARDIRARKLTDGKGFFFSSPVVMHPTDFSTALSCSNGRARILKTEDAGSHWFFSGSGYRGGRLKDLIFLDSGEMVFCLIDHGGWLTRDGGASFQFMKHPRLEGFSSPAGTASGNTVVLAVGDWYKSRLVRTENMGKNWEVIPGSASRIRLIHTHEDKPNLMYAGHLRSVDRGRTWGDVGHMIVAVNPLDNDEIYGTSQKGGVVELYHSTDMGETWARQSVIPKEMGRIATMIVDPFNPSKLLAGTAGGLWINELGTWRKLAAKGLNDRFGKKSISVLLAHPGMRDVFFAGKQSIGIGMPNGLLYSIDAGNSWVPIKLDHVGSNTQIYSIVMSPDRAGLFIGTAHGVYYVTIEGKNE